MRKFLKLILWVLASLLLLLGIVCLYIHFSGIPSYDVEVKTIQVDHSSEAVVRGRKLASMLCAGCHMDTETGKLSGKRMLDVPTEFGEIYSPNITQDDENGIGQWTDGELIYLLRTGIKKDGQYTPPYMAKLPTMADDDLHAIIAFLRSDDPMVAADPTPSIPSRPSFLTKILSRIAFKPFAVPSRVIPMPDSTDLVQLGRYLAHNLDCFSCHSADFKTNDYLDPPKSQGFFAGGNKTLDQQGRIILSPNLTPHAETGIGLWSKEDFVQAVKYGIKKEAQALSYPMMPYTQLTDREAGAIFDYLQTIPPVQNQVERSIYN